MRFLPCRIGSRQNGPGFAEPELELPEQTLALTDPQLDAVGLLNPGRQRLAIPQIDAHPRVARPLSQHSIDFFDLFLTQPAWASRPFSLCQTSQSLLLETVNPILDGTRRITQKPCYFRAGHPLGDQQNAMQPVIVARLVRTLDLLLQPKHRQRIRYPQWSHDSKETTFRPPCAITYDAVFSRVLLSPGMLADLEPCSDPRLAPQPNILDDVFGFSRAAQHGVCDAE